MDCPRCHSPLIVVEYDDVELDFCTQCEGLWFDSGEIQLVAAKMGLHAEECFSPRPATTDEAKLKCPLCRKKMVCDGLWLDRGELEQALAQPTTDSEEAPKERFAMHHLRGTFDNTAPDTESDSPSDTGNAG